LVSVFSIRSVQRTASVSSAPGAPLLLVLNGGDPASARVKQRLAKIVAERQEQGYDVVTSTAGDTQLAALLEQWWENPNGPADEAIEEALAKRNAYGILHVSISGDARRERNVREQLVHSTRPGAKDRRRVNVVAIVPPGDAPALPYLLINDHPAKVDPQVEAVINQTVASYREKGWDLKVADDLEVEVRKLLPPGKIESAATLPFMLRATLDQAQVGGVVRIEAAPGEGQPRDRVIVTIIHGADIPKVQNAPSTEAPPAAESSGKAPASDKEPSDVSGTAAAGAAT
jgi:hypothetical protein